MEKTNSEKFHLFIQSILSDEKEETGKTLIVQVTKRIKVAVLKEQLNTENKKIFSNFVKVISRIRDGLTARDLVGHANLYIMDYQSNIIQGVGHALGAWELVDPYSVEGCRCEAMNLLPMNKGLKY